MDKQAAWVAAQERGMRFWDPIPNGTIGTVFCPKCGFNGDVVTDFLKYGAEPFGCGREKCENFARRD